MPAPFDALEGKPPHRSSRSISARFPWLVFPLLPLPAVIIGLMLPLLLMLGLSKIYGFWSGASEFVIPGWYRLLADLLLGTVKFVTMPLVMLALTALAWRQRLSILWLLPCLLLLLPLITDLQPDFNTASQGARQTRHDFHFGLGWNWIWSTAGGVELGWGLLPGRLGKELQTGIYWGLMRQLLILASPAMLLWLRLRQRKEGAHVV